MSKIECKACKHKSLAFDNFNEISLSFPRKSYRIMGYIDLKDCLENFVKDEKMEECGYKCENCKKLDN